MTFYPTNPFNPEFCFETPLGKMCFPILSSPTFPGPPASSDEPELGNWSIVRSPQGEISCAAACINSVELLFTAEVERNNDVTTKSFHLSRNGEIFLTFGGRAYHDSQGHKAQCASKLSMFAKGNDIAYQMTISQESQTTARILAESKGSVTERTIDFLSPRCSSDHAEIGLCREFEEREQEKLEPFKELLVAVNSFYWKKAKGEVALLSQLINNPADSGTQASIWCGIARAGCWGLAAAGGAACCLGTATIGCVLCAGGFGAAGSGCSDSWSWC